MGRCARRPIRSSEESGMDSSSGKINYWPGFVDAFSNLVLALVFVIVVLAMSLGMFSGLMAKMAIQRALIEQRLEESQAKAGAGPGGGNAGESEGADGAAQAPLATPPADATPRQAPDASSRNAAPGQAQADGAVASGGAASSGAASGAVSGGAPVPSPSMPDEARKPRDGMADGLAAQASEARADAAIQATLRKENEALRQELAALRKKSAAQAQEASATAARAGSKMDAAAAEPDASRPEDRFGPMMPGGDPQFQQRIDADLARVLKEFGARQDRDAVIHVAIHVPNYALTENKRTALFYLISIKDYLMKKNVSPEQIRMHMDRAPAGQKDMTVSMSVEH
ncbi:hypothetical protein [Achromobacter xylosoxidans]|uniref:hypothetical protein n=1 Tax=Alcaligenes xylosoxydans xylosoxydans TaxID=85698 RepID=UPI001F13E664|nr:hypothetical protein [Achromobacter xylosoxidans]